jgi:hypothetical protein
VSKNRSLSPTRSSEQRNPRNPRLSPTWSGPGLRGGVRAHRAISSAMPEPSDAARADAHHSRMTGEREWSSSTSHGKNSTASSHRPSTHNHKALRIAICIAGQLRSFAEEVTYRNIFVAMIQPLRTHSNVFMALDTWAKDSGYKSEWKMKGPGGIVETDMLPNRTLPRQLLELYRPAAVEFGHASTPEACDDCTYTFQPSDMRCVPGSDNRLGQGYNMWRAHRLMVRHEAQHGMAHEWVLRLRPDELFARRLPAPASWPRYMMTAHPPPTLLVSTLMACSGTCTHDGWALMTRDVATTFMHQHFLVSYTYPSCLQHQRMAKKIYGNFKSTCPECRLAVTLRTHLGGMSSVDVCHVERRPFHPNHEIFYLSRPAIAGGPVSPARAQSAYQAFRQKEGLGNTVDEQLPLLDLPDGPKGGLCWDDPLNVSFRSELQFAVRNSTYESRHDEYWENQIKILYGDCNQRIEDCHHRGMQSHRFNDSDSPRRHDWKFGR